jgi:hypothetical protein
MAGGSPPSFISFTCANCQALYHVVKVEAGPETTEAEVTCLACGAPLPGREGKFVLKYFMLRHGATVQYGAVDRPRPENVPRRQFSARPQPPVRSGGARLLALFWPPGRRRRCSAQTVADEDAVGGFGHAAEPAARYGLRARRLLLGMLQSQKRASAGTEAVQRKEEKYDSATIAHDRVIRRQFLVIGQRPGRPRSSSTRWTSTVGTEFTLRRAPPQERQRTHRP